MSFKTPILCDRRVYAFKGKWKNPQNDIDENIFYFIKQPLTLVASYENGREVFKETITICVFGNKPFAKEDTITLDNGVKYNIVGYTANFFESNILVRDMVKPRIESFDLILE